MRLRPTLILTAALAGLAFAMPAADASAAERLVIESDQSQIIVLPSLPGSVVIGNPSIADATVEGNKLFVHGRSFGTTNLIVMDMSGKEVAHFEVSITHVTSNTVALYKGSVRESYNCAPLCESELQIGDGAVYSALVIEQTKKKIELATGTDTAKSDAPPAPQ
ncbi:MAG: pilus assembly protein N-terminal domain-containing protein [Rhizobiales bacterium]|nr:pilus assembly protein N-terminal domain-containing protein [Hyphomicrobiales bacterium]